MARPVLASDALAKSARFLADANEARERGDKEKAERLDEKAQFWLDRYNVLTGQD